MKKFIIVLLLLLSNQVNSQLLKSETLKSFSIPDGYTRVLENKYHEWITSLEITTKEEVKTFDGDTIYGLGDYYAGKFTYDIGDENLHQCADAAIYLNAKYHFDTGNLDRITYHFTNGKRYGFKQWTSGLTPLVTGNKSKLVIGPEKSNNTFREYLDIIFMYAGSWSLEKYDTFEVDLKDMMVGDIFIQGGFPGHTISVVDVVINKKTNNKLYMLAESYMPAQEQYILSNSGNVWYNLSKYSFKQYKLKRFKNRL